MRIIDLLSQARTSLNSQDPAQEAEYLIEAICGISRSHQLIHPDEELSEKQCQQFDSAIKRRIAGEPLAYITGSRGFWDMDLQVTPDVLIPRPDTECLVEQALQRIPADARWQIVDLGTGSGAIALVLARERPLCDITATDLSMAALVIAKENARLQDVKNISFAAGSWFQPIKNRLFEMIICNPPYIPVDDPHLKQSDLPAEPDHALISGGDGLDAIRKIISDSVLHLKPGAFLLLEHGYDQAIKVTELLCNEGFKEIFTEKDYGGNDRVTGGRNSDER
ncbi:MAG TPA: peptide chain release factor N(5)-glutamine methyltransferase [Gammaproteobacteria bacterium]|nr:peptide chain release factor N(5)-glutamine methyltransferase [Gammaproteobacteria bacterium]